LRTRSLTIAAHVYENQVTAATARLAADLDVVGLIFARLGNGAVPMSETPPLLQMIVARLQALGRACAEVARVTEHETIKRGLLDLQDHLERGDVDYVRSLDRWAAAHPTAAAAAAADNGHRISATDTQRFS